MEFQGLFYLCSARWIRKTVSNLGEKGVSEALATAGAIIMQAPRDEWVFWGAPRNNPRPFESQIAEGFAIYVAK
ncbi:MAG: hypothetical protein A2W61_06465 [Deltaproteobacteria bacterium RIFCSPLOWO2_01_44_7]|nr:MAG: hypothetical protein A2712_05470 [Deltaproteobacteria bacterium RIFCSPHIGHO2_01_FULL_43_49]OGQ14348.1 MAG: hypothetical protein A3D22_04915 [Deltaproteobacteria bacterium RIFCSPHIGHO2_02_FULL_44_53]OGQ27612.1 MAG: hypothetical protein A3D98_09260 [Deltaproteobacteria bacterium RIFCSPHIGHO2_12_FULL_44_21]OGQ30789.1 MAG: hypothetical protein A2979_01325 [Deltaproteobacteria bacterium RIFCSPLOWO2_01_FULL_45_74]OGQ41467.1 MAG: hypothetical protein A2W61_06465 [Deltaproteobacteria bacterium 